MTLTEQQQLEFEAVTKPVIKWLNDNCNPHTTVAISPTHAELHAGIAIVSTEEYLKD